MSSSSSKRGKIVLIEIPFTDLTGTKLRPALVVSADEYNQNSSDVVLAKITGSGHDSSYELPLNASMLKSGGLNKPSFIDLGALWTIDKKLILRDIATVDDKTIKLCDEKIKRVFGI